MKTASRFLAALLIVLPMSCSPAPENEGYRIAVIPKGSTHEFWKSVEAGALEAARDLSTDSRPVSVNWKAPLRENDREQQIQVVEGFISQNIDGLVLAPLDDKALVRPVDEAARAGLPTVVIDSDLDYDQIVSFVATDNRRGGELAAEHLGGLLDGRGRVLLLRYQEGSASTRNREEGFLSKLTELYPQVELLSSGQYSGPTRETAKQAAENLINRFQDRIDGIFCPNESSTDGMLLALQDAGMAGQVRFVGFDSTETLLAALRNGHLHGLVVQNPREMGYRGVQTLVEYLDGQVVEPRIDTGVSLLTKDDVGEVKSR